MAENRQAVATCPECESNIPLPASAELWMRLTCPECGTQLEIVDDSPWELDYVDDDYDEDEKEEADYENYADDLPLDDE